MSKRDLVGWLMAAQTPSIRYITLRRLLDRPEHDPDVLKTRQAIMTEGPVPAIFSRQTASGQWADEQSYYTPKYVSSHWSMTLLAELHVDEADPRFQRGVHYMLDATAKSMARDLENGAHGFSCFWGNLLRYALHAGQVDDDRVQAVVSYALRDLREGSCVCHYNSGYACAWGVVRTLWGLAALPESYRTPEYHASVDGALGFLLDSHNLVSADYPTPDDGKVSYLWGRLNFPLFYQADILLTLRALAELNRLDSPGAQAALDWVEGRQDKHGHWRGSSPYRQRTWRELGDRDETDRWVSLHTALILRRAGRLTINGGAAS